MAIKETINSPLFLAPTVENMNGFLLIIIPNSNNYVLLIFLVVPPSLVGIFIIPESVQ